MRRSTLALTLAVLTTIFVTGCAHSPRVMDETSSMLTIRSDYLETNPDGPFNSHIMSGEVVKGMNYVEVLASWGVPHARYRTNVGEDEVEYWHYLARDDVSKDWTQYTFVFEKKSLVEWDMMRHVSKNGSLAYWGTDEPALYPRLQDVTRESHTAFVKK